MIARIMSVVQFISCSILQCPVTRSLLGPYSFLRTNFRLPGTYKQESKSWNGEAPDLLADRSICCIRHAHVYVCMNIWTDIYIYIYICVCVCVCVCVCMCVCRDNSVGIATRNALDGPRIESRWGWNFPQLTRQVLGPTQPPIEWVPDLSRG
jgi:hypothetical protein